MKTLLIALLFPLLALAKDQIAQDDASQSAYSSEWKSGSNGGSGFGPWTQQTLTSGDPSNAGFYIATQENNADLNGIAVGGKAFGMFANGVSFEVASAFRAFSKPLGVGESFSFTMEHDRFEKKFDSDSSAAGAIGITLRTGDQAGSIEDYNKNARFEFGIYGGQANYQIYDGEENHDTGVPFTDAGLSIKFTLLTADTYDLEITTLADKKTTKLSNRKLGGASGGSLDSFCIFDRNGEKADAYFNSFAVGKE